MMEIIDVNGSHLTEEEIQEKKERYIWNVDNWKKYFTSKIEAPDPIPKTDINSNIQNTNINSPQVTKNANKTARISSPAPDNGQTYNLAGEITWEQEMPLSPLNREMELSSTQNGALDFIKRNFSNLVNPRKN